MILDFLCSSTYIRWLLFLCWTYDNNQSAIQSSASRERAVAPDDDCLHKYNMRSKVSYNIFNDNYPSKYDAGFECLYIVRSRSNTKLSLICNEFDIPRSEECEDDAFIISRSGNKSFHDGAKVCGKKFVYTVTDANKIAIKLTSTDESEGGIYKCNIRVVKPDSNQFCTCGSENRKVDHKKPLVSTDTAPRQYPCMAGLLDINTEKMFAGAVIISTQYALTTAHALSYQPKRRKVRLIVDMHDFAKFNLKNSTKNVYLVSKFFIHNKYDMLATEYNIALIKTTTEIVFGPNVGPACLPFNLKKLNIVKESVIALGWKKKKKIPVHTDVLQEIRLRITSQKECRKRYILHHNDLCTQPYVRSEEDCNYYPGGPILLRDIGRLYLVGLQTYLLCETKKVSKHTRITVHLKWIKQITKRHICSTEAP